MPRSRSRLERHQMEVGDGMNALLTCKGKRLSLDLLALGNFLDGKVNSQFYQSGRMVSTPKLINNINLPPPAKGWGGG